MPDIDWRVGEGSERETITSSTSARRSRRWVLIVIVVILGASLGVAYRSLPEPAPRPSPTLPPTPQPSPTRPALPAKLYAVIDQEAQALADGDVETYLALLAPGNINWVEQQRISFYDWGRPTNDRPLYTIIDFKLSTSTNAWADIRQFRNGLWFRETRFYQWQKDRWLRVELDPFFWSGQTETLDTPRFHAIYALEDRDLVPPLVTQMEEAYPLICRDLGCVEAAAEFTYTVRFNPTPENGWWLSADARELHFPSPRFTGMFEDSPLDNSNVLQFITIAATQRVYYGAATQWNGDAPGHIVFTSILTWALRRVGNESDDPARIIAYLKTQEPVPLENLWGKGYVFDKEQQVTVPRTDYNVIYPEGALVIYFVEQEYGAQSMPKLLKALGTAESFVDVVETGLGVPFAEFDQKWQAWIKQNLEGPR